MYNQSDEQVKNVLDVWKIIEVLTPNKNETLNSYFTYVQKHAATQKEFYKEISKKEALFLLQDAPFEKLDKTKLDIDLNENEVAVHWHIYLGYLKWSEAEIDILKKVKNLSKLDQEFLNDYNNHKDWQEQPTITPIAGLTIDENGKYVENSMVISTAAYALGKIMKNDFQEKELKDLANFIDNNNSLIDEVFSESEKIYFKDKKKDSLAKILDLKMIDLLVEKLDIDEKYLFNRSEICVRRITSHKKKKDKPIICNFAAPSLEMFNSFFLRPLDFIRANNKNIEPESAAAKYLGKADKPSSIDILKQPEALQTLLSPFNMQIARWCSSPNNSLAALQAGAVNQALSLNLEKLFAVNGPPGTGKTTILFDLIANIYVDRALRLVDLKDPTDGFLDKKYSHQAHFNHHIRALEPSLQNYGMVVASSNNNAVENISKEISLYNKIDKSYHEDLSYFKQLLDGEDKNHNWGIFAAALGNRKNKKRFINKFWKYKEEEEDSDKNDKIYTMLQYLNLLNNYGCKDKAPAHFKPEYCNSSEELNKAWDKACANFKNLADEIQLIYNNISSLIEFSKRKKELIREKDLGIIYEEKKEKYKELESELNYKNSKTLEIDYELKLLNLGFFEKIHAFFKTTKYSSFYEKKLELVKLKNKYSEEINYINTNIKNIKAEINKIESSIEEIKHLNNEINLSIIYLKNKNFNVKDFEEDLFWKNWQENFEDLNKVTPYFNPEFEKLRSKLFISAVKLHEIFINANSDNFWHSLKYFFDVAINSSDNPEMNKIAWQNFFMVVPVVSTTFHSFDRMFATASHNEIPWLFIDEAGQIPPQYAASAIYKSKKVVVVGDPLQTEPISILKQDLIKKLCENFKVLYHDWSPSEVSLQNLADRNSLYQTNLNNVKVGFPLLVHRRCQNPMFKICNKIAYSNKMIFCHF